MINNIFIAGKGKDDNYQIVKYVVLVGKVIVRHQLNLDWVNPCLHNYKGAACFHFF